MDTQLSHLDLTNKIALITGSSRGIGRAIAIKLALHGAFVALNYVSDEESVESVANIIRNNGGRCSVHKADVSSLSEVSEMVTEIKEMQGTIDILVNNAGITKDNLFIRMDESSWQDVISTNLTGTFYCSKAVIRLMLRKKYGRIINITSIAGQIGNAGQANYAASKAGQIGFTKALAREVASRNITVNAIAAGYIETDIWNDVPDDIKENIAQMIPLGRKGSPEDIANAVLYLASDLSSYITGQTINVDGGIVMY